MITPVPVSVVRQNGRFPLPAGTEFCMDGALPQAVAEGIQSLLPSLRPGEDGPVRFRFDSSLGRAAYRLRIDAAGVLIDASTGSGALYGAATLRQLLLGGEELPHLIIEDAPRFPWRGMHLDVCRHFFPLSIVETIVDLLALYKFNVLHFHISDDQGFRIESERFPRLNEIGSRRASSATKRGAGEVQDHLPHGGFYTKQEIRHLVAYCAARGIMLVPELDVPGHTTAILAAYPALSCDGRETAVSTSYGIKDFSSHILCAGNQAVFDFLEALIDELLELFPAPYFHLGGDEAGKREWKKCPRCQAVIQEEKLSGERALQGHMLERLRQHLASRGRDAIIWNDGLADTTGTAFISEHWTPPALESTRRTAAHLNAGGRAIMSGFRSLYFDYPYALTPLKKTYEHDMFPRGLSTSAQDRVLGGECCLWSEWIEDENKLFFNLLPRLAAAGELFWSADAARDYESFVARLPAQYRLYEELGVPYAGGMERAPGLLARLVRVATFFHRDAYAEVNAARASKIHK